MDVSYLIILFTYIFVREGVPCSIWDIRCYICWAFILDLDYLDNVRLFSLFAPD